MKFSSVFCSIDSFVQMDLFNFHQFQSVSVELTWNRPHPIDSFGASPLPWKEGVNLSQEDDRSYFSEPNPAFQSSALPPLKFFDSASPLSTPQPWERFHK